MPDPDNRKLEVHDSPLTDDVVASPNFNDRRSGAPDMLLLHYTGMDDPEKSLKWLCMEKSEVSSHYFIFQDGRIVQSVAEDKRAWHAGLSFWAGERDINSRSIGIEIANGGHDYGLPDFETAQISKLMALCNDIIKRHSIRPERVLAHSDVAPRRKKDPGEKFPWEALAAQGIGHFVTEEIGGDGRFFQRGDEGDPVAALQTMLGLYGYEIDVTGSFDEHTVAVIEAFQRHFRQSRVDGVADASTIATLHKLLVSLPSPIA
ncbi:MAG: N-acetylmuramoyl-L-alanine amidase [Pseudomonadota bacterium]